jgi:uncharacterized protein YbaR (Trm112 family)
MAANVASLDDRRAARSAEVLACTCGSEWFRLVGHDNQPPAVTLNADRSITGYAGVLVCNDCGRTQ